MIACYRKQYAVGQGGLHFGMISYPYNDDYNNFAYIYDCGCSSGLSIIKKKIDDIVNQLKKQENLTYLYIFISHVHTDHINGLSYLCKQLQYNKIDSQIPKEHIVFVLPFMKETDKLMAAGKILADNISDSEETLKFIQNPKLLEENFVIPEELKVQTKKQLRAQKKQLKKELKMQKKLSQSNV